MHQALLPFFSWCICFHQHFAEMTGKHKLLRTHSRPDSTRNIITHNRPTKKKKKKKKTLRLIRFYKYWTISTDCSLIQNAYMGISSALWNTVDWGHRIKAAWTLNTQINLSALTPTLYFFMLPYESVLCWEKLSQRSNIASIRLYTYTVSSGWFSLNFSHSLNNYSLVSET